MKKHLLPICLLIPFALLASCKSNANLNERVSLTYGTYIETSVNNLKTLSNDELVTKVDSGEVFLLAAYQGEYSVDCLCWSTFETVLINFINKYHQTVYLFDAQEQDDSIKDLKIKKVNESTPMFYIFSGKEQIQYFSYSKNQDKAIFNDTTGEALHTRINKKIKEPKMFYVDDSYLEQQIKGTAVVLYIRNACGDCKYVIPNLIIPYINRNEITNEILIFDMQYYYDLQQRPEISSAPYSYIKNKYCLTEKANYSYGYLEGVVPTIQHYKDGVLDDSAVYFNDSIDVDNEGNYYISNSFYSNDRLTSIKYANNVKDNVLIGKQLPKEEVVVTTSGYAFWAQEKAAKYHDPLFKSFLDMYCPIASKD